MKDWQNFKYTVWIRQTTAHTNTGSAEREGMKCRSNAPALLHMLGKKKVFCKIRGENYLPRSQPRLAELNCCVFNRLHVQMFHPQTSIDSVRAELHTLFTCFRKDNVFLSAYSTHLYPNSTLYSEIFKKKQRTRRVLLFFLQQQ